MDTEKKITPFIPHYQAVYTRYIGATDTRGARISVTIARGSNTVRGIVPVKYEYEQRDAHLYAADSIMSSKLDDEKGWQCVSCGETLDGRGYVFMYAWTQPKG